jgi:hypothetical protein
MIFGIKDNRYYFWKTFLNVLLEGVLSTFRVEDTSRWEDLCFLQTQEMGDKLRLWEYQCETVALKREEARGKVSIHAREERGLKGITEINYIDEM